MADPEPLFEYAPQSVLYTNAYWHNDVEGAIDTPADDVVELYNLALNNLSVMAYAPERRSFNAFELLIGGDETAYTHVVCDVPDKLLTLNVYDNVVPVVKFCAVQIICPDEIPYVRRIVSVNDITPEL